MKTLVVFTEAKYRNPDSIHFPARELKRLTNNQYQKIGGSRIIGRYLRLDNPRSGSFWNFIRGVRRVMGMEKL